MSSPDKKTSPVLIASAWMFVAVPLGWGVYQTVVKSLPLFHGSGATNPPPASANK